MSVTANGGQQREPGDPRAEALPGTAAALLGVAVAGPDQVILSANHEFLSILRATAAQVTGTALSGLFEPVNDPVCAAGLARAFAEGREHACQLRALRHDGAGFLAELRVVPVHGPLGGPERFVVVLRDTSASSPAERALESSNRHLHELLDHLPAGVVVHGKDSRILSVNALGALLLGQPAEQLVGKAAGRHEWHFLRADGSVMPVEEYPVYQTITRKASLSNQVVGIERGDGQGLAWVICNTYLVCDETGELAEAVVCFTDYTDIKRAEQLLQKSEERLRLVLQGSNDAPWDWNLATGEIYYSPRWWEMLGRAPDELPVDRELWMRLAHPEDQARASDEFERALSGAGHAYEIELRLQHRDGHYVPVLSRGCILRDGEGRAVRVSGTNTDLSERKEAERNIHQLAYFDYLTGLPNRRFLMDQLHKLLSRCGRTRELGALLFIDLDNFKLLNDTLGHDVGDMLLRQVAYRLRHAVRESDFVARLGGDEFVIVLDNLGPDAALAAAEADAVGIKVLAVCGETYALPARLSRSTPSIGIAMFGASTESVDVLLRQADLAMYQAKAAGRNTLRFFDPLMQAAIDRRYALEHDLREGLLRRQFVLYCQPQFDGNGRLCGGEVLLRWNHPERGMVGPNDFIGLAETTGLVLPLGRWVLRETCLRLAAWARHPVLSRLTLAVNVSAQQMRSADFAAQTLAIVADSGADPGRLGLELTESLLAENIEDVIDKMNRLKAAGVCFSIDDFGTGYSSLSYLKRFPLETLKIDQSFVHDIHVDPDAAAIVEVIITLARKLGLKVIAEGVEQDAQRQFLRKSGCDGFQGYLLGRPVSLDEFEQRYG